MVLFLIILQFIKKRDPSILKWKKRNLSFIKRKKFIAFRISTPNNQGKPLKKYTFIVN